MSTLTQLATAGNLASAAPATTSPRRGFTDGALDSACGPGPADHGLRPEQGVLCRPARISCRVGASLRTQLPGVHGRCSRWDADLLDRAQRRLSGWRSGSLPD